MVKNYINIHIVLKVLSRVLLISGIFLLLCAVVAEIYKEPLKAFLHSAIITFSVYVLILLLLKKNNVHDLRRREAYLTVTLAWLIMSLIGTLPYMLSDSIPSFINAFFESTSGFTTTGSSILTDIESLPKSILFWRSLTHWIGGIGIIVMVIIIMPSLKIGSYHLFSSESSLKDKIHPRMKSVSLRLLLIYLSLTFAETALLLLGKMNLFESLTHSFGTVATGGFSPKNDSIAGYSAYIQYIITLFMFLSGTNFIIHYFIFKRQFTKVKHNNEFWFYVQIVMLAGAFVCLCLYFFTEKSFELSLREAFFQVLSIITCTGFATTDYLQWPKFLWLFIFMLMFIGGSTGSTSGGIKVARHLVFAKTISKIYRTILHPNAVTSIKLNNKNVPEEKQNSINGFIFSYIFIFIIGTLVLYILGVDGRSAAGAAATTMGGIGPGIGTVGPASNFFHLSGAAKSILIALMLLGRLELYTVLVLFTPKFWKA